jgi:hypothetical protein
LLSMSKNISALMLLLITSWKNRTLYFIKIVR